MRYGDISVLVNKYICVKYSILFTHCQQGGIKLNWRGEKPRKIVKSMTNDWKRRKANDTANEKVGSVKSNGDESQLHSSKVLFENGSARAEFELASQKQRHSKESAGMSRMRKQRSSSTNIFRDRYLDHQNMSNFPCN